MIRLPRAASARVDDVKVRDYLLNPLNVQSRGKARLFQQYGFARDNWNVLAAALRRHAIANQIIRTDRSAYGVKYVVECTLETPDSRNPCMRSVWIVETGHRLPRLVTAY